MICYNRVPTWTINYGFNFKYYYYCNDYWKRVGGHLINGGVSQKM